MSSVVSIVEHGPEIRALREAAGMTQAQLAAAVGTSQQTIDRIERCEVRWSRAVSPALTFLRLERSGVAKPNASPLPPADVVGTTDVVVPAQREIEVYLGGRGDVVIRMEGGSPGDDEDQVVLVRPENVDAVIAAMLRVRAEASA